LKELYFWDLESPEDKEMVTLSVFNFFMLLLDLGTLATLGRSRLDFRTITLALELKSSVSYNFTGILTPPIALFLK